MGIGERWQRWWDRLTHGESQSEGEPPHRPPTSARVIGQVPKGPNGELKLAVDPDKPGVPQRGKVRSAGFDPYSNDAGYEKPGNWDKVDPR